jgi:hypothetical protein
MPPVHVLPHILYAGGIPAMVGLVVGAILSWPQADVATGPFGITSYHNSLGGAHMTIEAATGYLIGFGILGALAGLAVGYLLIALGVVEKDELGISE